MDAAGLERELMTLEKLSFEVDAEIVFNLLKKVIPGYIYARQKETSIDERDASKGNIYGLKN